MWHLKGENDVICAQLLSGSFVAGKTFDSFTRLWTARREPDVFAILAILQCYKV
jgi:hypothetical protein